MSEQVFFDSLTLNYTEIRPTDVCCIRRHLISYYQWVNDMESRGHLCGQKMHLQSRDGWRNKREKTNRPGGSSSNISGLSQSNLTFNPQRPQTEGQDRPRPTVQWKNPWDTRIRQKDDPTEDKWTHGLKYMASVWQTTRHRWKHIYNHGVDTRQDTRRNRTFKIKQETVENR